MVLGERLRSEKIFVKEKAKVRPVRIQVGMEQPQEQPQEPPNRFQVEEEVVQARPVTANPNFPLVISAFCGLRLVRPMLLSACFADGPQAQDGASQAAMVFAWFMCLTGLLGSLLISRQLRKWVDDHQGIPEPLKTQVDPAALALLLTALFSEILHEILALANWKYFWSTGIIDQSMKDAMLKLPLAYMMILLHISGLFGTVILVVLYARGFKAAWEEMIAKQRRLAKEQKKVFRDVEAGDGSRRVSDEETAEKAAERVDLGVERPINGWRNQRASSKGSAPAAHWGPRQAGREASPRRPSQSPDSDSERQGTPRNAPPRSEHVPRGVYTPRGERGRV